MEAMVTQLLKVGAAAQADRKSPDAPERAEGGFQALLTRQAAVRTDAPQEDGAADGAVSGQTQPQAPTQKDWEQQLALAALVQGVQTAPLPLVQTPEAPPETAQTPAVQALPQELAAQPLGQDPKLPQEGAQALPAAQETLRETETALRDTAPAQRSAAPQDSHSARPQAQVQALSHSPDKGGEEAAPAMEYSAAELRPVFRQVEHIPIQVGEVTAAQTDQTAPPVDTQVAQALTAALEQGQSQVRIQLQPKALGRLEVEMTWSREGALRVSIQAESSHTQSLLERTSDSLRHLLARSDRPEVYVEVRRQDERQDRPFYQEQQHHSQQQQSQQQSQHRSRRQATEDFLQQLRLGLIPMEQAAG